MPKWAKVVTLVAAGILLLAGGYGVGRYDAYRRGTIGIDKPALDLADGIGKAGQSIEGSAERVDRATELAGDIAKRLSGVGDSAAIIEAASERARAILEAAQARGNSGIDSGGSDHRDSDMEVEDGIVSD